MSWIPRAAPGPGPSKTRSTQIDAYITALRCLSKMGTEDWWHFTGSLESFQLISWFSWRACLQKSRQGDPRGRDVSKWWRGWRAKATCHGGEREHRRGRQEASNEGSRKAGWQEHGFWATSTRIPVPGMPLEACGPKGLSSLLRNQRF